MIPPDLAGHCRRLARSVGGDPLEASAADLAEEHEAASVPAAPSLTERHDLDVANETSWSAHMTHALQSCERPAAWSQTAIRSWAAFDAGLIEQAPGAQGPRSGTYELLNVMGAPNGERVRLREEKALPPTPFGWNWWLVQRGHQICQ